MGPSSEGQLVGAIDEAALNLHTLDDAAVLSHYEAMRGAGGAAP